MESQYKRGIVCEELVAITDDFRKATILKQLLFWMVRTKDIQEYIEKQQEKIEEDLAVEVPNGWVYKNSAELAEEIMVASPPTVRTKLSELVESGYVDSKESEHPYDQTKMYRPNLEKIEADLRKEDMTLLTVLGKDAKILSELIREMRPVDPSDHMSDQSERSNTKTTTETNTSTNVEGAKARTGEMEEAALPPDSTDTPSYGDKAKLAVSNGPHQAIEILRTFDTDNQRNIYLSTIFGELFCGPDHDYFESGVHGRLAAIRNRIDQAKDVDGHEWLIEHIFKAKQSGDFDRDGPEDYLDALPHRVLNYLQKIVSEQTTDVPEPEDGDKLSLKQVDHLVEAEGYDTDNFKRFARNVDDDEPAFIYKP